MMIINYFNIAEKFGKHWSYGLGLILIKVVFVGILAFDNSKYLGKKTVTKTATKGIAKPVAKAPAKKVVAKAPAKKIVKKAPAKKVVKKVKTLTKKK